MWTTSDRRLDEWSSGFFSSRDLASGGASAPLISLSPPIASLSTSNTLSKSRIVRVHVRSQRNASFIRVYLPFDTVLLSVDDIPVGISAPPADDGNSTMFSYAGLPPSGFQMELKCPSDNSLRIGLCDTSYDLPNIAYQQFRTRPSSIIERGFPLGDTTEVTKSYNL